MSFYKENIKKILKKINQEVQQRFETTVYSEKSLTTCVYSFSCHYFGGENVHIVQVFIQGLLFEIFMGTLALIICFICIIYSLIKSDEKRCPRNKGTW